MRNLIAVKINEETVYIEAEHSPGSESTSRLTDTVERAEDAFARAKTTITCITEDTIRTLHSMGPDVIPDEFTLEFGIKFSAEGQAFVVSTAGEASLKLTVTYRNSQKQD